MRYSLRQLEVFLAVARFESVTQAARALGMSQSAVSGSLAELEHQFEIRLFERVGKRLELSELGRALRGRAEALEQQARELENELANRTVAGPLRVGATLSIGNYTTAPVLARYLKELPDARVTIEIANTSEIARKVKNFEIDLGLIEGELVDPDLTVTRWRDDELCVFCAPSHRFARKRVLGDVELRSADWILREPGSGTRQAFERALHGLLPELHVVLELEHTEAIKSAVKHGVGVGCVARVALEEELRSGSLVACRVPERDFRRHFYFVLHEQKYPSVAIRKWLALSRALTQ